jgi:hypothetical protein
MRGTKYRPRTRTRTRPRELLAPEIRHLKPKKLVINS